MEKNIFRIVQYNNHYIIERLHKYWFLKSKWISIYKWHYFANDDGGWCELIKFDSNNKAILFKEYLEKELLPFKKRLFSGDIILIHKRFGNFITNVDLNELFE